MDMRWIDGPALPLIEQFLQVATLVEDFVARAAQARRMPVLDIRTLLCLARMAPGWADLPTPSEISMRTGYPRNRISESLSRLSQEKLVRNYGTATSDRRTRAFKVTEKGERLAAEIASSLQGVEGQLRVAMRIQSASGHSENLIKASKLLQRMPSGSLRS